MFYPRKYSNNNTHTAFVRFEDGPEIIARESMPKSGLHSNLINANFSSNLVTILGPDCLARKHQFNVEL